MGTNDSPWGVCIPVYLMTCVPCAGFVGVRSELELELELELGPVVCGAVEEVMQLAREPCASARGERMFCSAEASWGVDELGIKSMQDVPACKAGVGKSMHV